MATVWTLLASAVPQIVVPGALLSIAGGVPTVRSVVTAGGSGSGSLTTPFNANATAIDALGRAGAGAYAIDWDSNPASAVLPGLDLTVSSGLTLAIAAGQAVLDSVRQKETPTTLALSDNMARIYIWMAQNGTVTAVNNSLTPPAGVQVFLGSCVTNNPTGSITGIDGSGVMYFKGPSLWRKTADAATPTDAPPAGIAFLNKGVGGSWYWDGEAYSGEGAQAALFPTLIAAGEVWTIPVNRGAITEKLLVNGSLVVSGDLRIGGF